MRLPFEDVAVYCQFCAEVIFLAFIHTKSYKEGIQQISPGSTNNINSVLVRDIRKF